MAECAAPLLALWYQALIPVASAHQANIFSAAAWSCRVHGTRCGRVACGRARTTRTRAPVRSRRATRRCRRLRRCPAGTVWSAGGNPPGDPGVSAHPGCWRRRCRVSAGRGAARARPGCNRIGDARAEPGAPAAARRPTARSTAASGPPESSVAVTTDSQGSSIHRPTDLGSAPNLPVQPGRRRPSRSARRGWRCRGDIHKPPARAEHRT